MVMMIKESWPAFAPPLWQTQSRGFGGCDPPSLLYFDKLRVGAMAGEGGRVMAADVQKVADAMYEMIKKYDGQKKFKAGDLIKEMMRQFGADGCDKKMCKAAIRILVDSGKCVYTYFGGSFIELPKKEGAAN